MQTIYHGEAMPKFLSTLPLIASLSIGGAVFAQETATTEPEAGAATETTGAAAQTAETATETTETQTGAQSGTVAETLDMGTEVAPSEPATYIRESFDDWQLECVKAAVEGGEELCQMYQLLREDAGNPIAEISLFRLPKGSQAVAGATIVVPLGTLIPEQLKIAVDGGKAKSFGYSFCSMGGCVARVGLTQADIDAFKRGVVANLTIVPAQAPDQKVVIKASLKGFTAAYDQVSTLKN